MIRKLSSEGIKRSAVAHRDSKTCLIQFFLHLFIVFANIRLSPTLLDTFSFETLPDQKIFFTHFHSRISRACCLFLFFAVSMLVFHTKPLTMLASGAGLEPDGGSFNLQPYGPLDTIQSLQPRTQLNGPIFLLPRLTGHNVCKLKSFI